MQFCRRCGIPVYFDDGRCINLNLGTPHDITKCNTKHDHVWCPKCRDAVPQRNPCYHYRYLGYEEGQSEEFFIKLILEDYKKGDFNNRWRKRKSSQFDKMKPGQKCSRCNKDLTRMNRVQQDQHEQECKKQSKLEEMSH